MIIRDVSLEKHTFRIQTDNQIIKIDCESEIFIKIKNKRCNNFNSSVYIYKDIEEVKSLLIGKQLIKVENDKNTYVRLELENEYIYISCND